MSRWGTLSGTLSVQGGSSFAVVGDDGAPDPSLGPPGILGLVRWFWAGYLHHSEHQLPCGTGLRTVWPVLRVGFSALPPLPGPGGG
jgi:hypothetical protein